MPRDGADAQAKGRLRLCWSERSGKMPCKGQDAELVLFEDIPRSSLNWYLTYKRNSRPTCHPRRQYVFRKGIAQRRIGRSSAAGNADEWGIMNLENGGHCILDTDPDQLIGIQGIIYAKGIFGFVSFCEKEISAVLSEGIALESLVDETFQ